MTRIQLWSYNYDPEPTGIGPVSAAWAGAMRRRGHEVTVVAAHPHYPSPAWGRSLRPYREIRDGISVIRLPIWVGRTSGRARIRQEFSYLASLFAATPALGSADVIVAVSPSFPALSAAMLAAKLRRIPWVLWLQDILPDAAVATELLRGGVALAAAERLERAAYASASAVIVISDAHRLNLLQKGVPEDHIHRIYNPATMAASLRERSPRSRPPTLLAMGNIGYSQGLESIVRVFEASRDCEGLRLLITGAGVAASDVRSAIKSPRVEMPGILSGSQLIRELDAAALGVVSQRDDIEEFNLPSKLANYMMMGVPVLGVVPRGSEVARIVTEAGAGWIVEPHDHQGFVQTVLQAIDDEGELRKRGMRGNQYARAEFDVALVAEKFDGVLDRVVDQCRTRAETAQLRRLSVRYGGLHGARDRAGRE